MQIFLGFSYVLFFLNKPKFGVHTPKSELSTYGNMVAAGTVLGPQCELKRAATQNITAGEQEGAGPSGDGRSRRVQAGKPRTRVLREDPLAAWTSWGSTSRAQGRLQGCQHQFIVCLPASLSLSLSGQGEGEGRKQTPNDESCSWLEAGSKSHRSPRDPNPNNSLWHLVLKGNILYEVVFNTCLS